MLMTIFKHDPLYWMLAQKQVPLGVVQTINGQPSTDPNDADNGSQLPMAGHKG